MINKENIPKEFKISRLRLYSNGQIDGTLIMYNGKENSDIANLIAEAFNVFNKTEMTPVELNDKVDELIESNRVLKD